jgi:recombination associated protein RdgC
MGLLSGSMALRRYRVMSTPPADFKELYEKAVRAHALVPLDPESGRAEEKSIGWCSLFDENDLDLSFSKFHLDGRLVLSLRVDMLKPPAAEVKRLLKQRQREIEANRKEPLSASALRELKDMIVIDLRRRTPPKTRTVDMLWKLDEQRLYFFSHSKAMNEAFLALFAQTFNLGIDIEGPGFWARTLADKEKLDKPLGKARPTIELLGGFVGLRPCPRAHEIEDVWNK